MQIKRIYNNNVALATDETGEEHVVIGRGVCFGHHVGDEIDPDRIEKVFSMQGEENKSRLEKLLKSIPSEYLLVAEEITEMVRRESDLTIDDGIVIALADHISLAVERERRGVTLANPMLFEISHTYRKEYELAQRAAVIIHDRLDLWVSEEEIGFITLHIVNATMNQRPDKLIKSMELVKQILAIVRETFDDTIDTESLAYERFMRHLQFFAQRVLDEGSSENDSLPMLLEQESYPDAFECAENIATFVEETYGVRVPASERSYLTYHLATLAVSARRTPTDEEAATAEGAADATEAGAGADATTTERTGTTEDEAGVVEEPAATSAPGAPAPGESSADAGSGLATGSAAALDSAPADPASAGNV